MPIKALLLDLDGTLVNTAPDMVSTLNHVLKKHNRPPVELEVATKLVSNGARGLIEFGFSKKFNHKQLKCLVEEFLNEYVDNLSTNSTLYADMYAVLEYCVANQIQWGVVTNKPFALSQMLLRDLDILDQCSVLLGGDSLRVKKPNPGPLLHSCMLLNLAASECLYVGDHERDIAAGKAAGMFTAAALWGYIGTDQQPHQWGADYLINKPGGLLTLLQDKNNDN